MTDETGGGARFGGVFAAGFLGAAVGAVAGALAMAAIGRSDPAAPADPSARPDACRDAGERLTEVATLLQDAAAPSLARGDAGRLLAAAAGTLSAVEARLHRHGACRSDEIGRLRTQVAARRAEMQAAALAPVLAGLAAHETVAADRPAHAAMAGLARARGELGRAQAEADEAGEPELRLLQRRLERAFGEWSREQQRRYDLWALGEARALDRWARENLSDIPLRGAGRDAIAAELVRRLGPIDVRLTGPAVQAVHAELFQRLWRELGEDARIAAVADIVAAAKRSPGEF